MVGYFSEGASPVKYRDALAIAIFHSASLQGRDKNEWESGRWGDREKRRVGLGWVFRFRKSVMRVALSTGQSEIEHLKLLCSKNIKNMDMMLSSLKN
jgi:hypothetical protein